MLIEFRSYPLSLEECICIHKEDGSAKKSSFSPLGWSFTLIFRVIKRVVEEWKANLFSTVYDKTKKIIVDELKNNYGFNGLGKDATERFDFFSQFLTQNIANLEVEDFNAFQNDLSGIIAFTYTLFENQKGSKAQKQLALQRFCAYNGYNIKCGDKFYNSGIGKDADPDIKELPMFFQNKADIQGHKEWKQSIIEYSGKYPAAKEILQNSEHSLSSIRDALYAIQKALIYSNDQASSNWINMQLERANLRIKEKEEEEERIKRNPRSMLSCTSYKIDSISEYLLVAIFEILEANLIIKKCEMCNRLFVVQKGKTRFCDFRCTDLDYPNKTCKELRKNKKQKQREDDDIVEHLYHNVRSLLSPSRPNKYELHSAYLEVSGHFRRAIRNKKRDMAWRDKAEIAYIIWSARFFEREYKGVKLRGIIEKNTTSEKQRERLLFNFEKYNSEDSQSILHEILDTLPQDEKETVQQHRKLLVKERYLDQ